MTEKHTEVLIIGSGPAGYTAAIYAARANLSPIMVSGYEQGGQLTTTTDVENFPGFATAIQGPWLMEQMKLQAEHVGTEILFDMVSKVDFNSRPFVAECESGTKITADTVVISTGAQAKWLGLESETLYRGFGISGCATCDGFFFKNQEVAVIGGGNTAVEEALYLTKHASKVHLIHRRDTLRSEKVLQERLFAHEKINFLPHYQVKEFVGKDNPKELTHLILASTNGGDDYRLDVSGAFVAIGHKPATDIFRETGLNLDKDGYINVDIGTTNTNIPGVFACGDVQDKIYRQAVTAAGTGCMAALDAQRFLEE